MKLQFKLLLTLSSFIPQTLCYLSEACRGIDCCGGGEYLGNGCCAAVSCPAVDYGNNCAAVLCSNQVEDPQCCNGSEYPNSCQAKCSNAGTLDNCRSGNCAGDEPVICPAVFAPVCCNGQTFSNDCVAAAELGDAAVASNCTQGECEGVICPAIFAPVCCNGQTFSNDCVARGEFGDDVDSVCVPALCYLSEACRGIDCCGGGEYLGNGCCAAVSCPAVDYGNNCAAVSCSNQVEDPQCCNGSEYPNSCLARCSNAGTLDNCRPGNCAGDEPVFCPAVFAPVCCNGQTFSNDCVAAAELGDAAVASNCTQGECVGVICPAIFAPVCCNGQTFSNDCVARSEFGDDVDSVCVSGECEDEPVICPAVFAPLCCNGETFSNDCFAAAEFGDDVDSVCVSGACEDQVACLAIYDPVCCYGTELFGNSCEAGRKYGGLANFSEVCVGGECGPECEQPTNCLLDPCQLAMCRFSGAVCVPNYCTGASYLGTDVGGPCTPIWVDPQNQVVLTKQQCFTSVGFGNNLGGVGNYSPVCCDGRTYFNIGRAESDLGAAAAAELCIDGVCRISTFPRFTSP